MLKIRALQVGRQRPRRASDCGASASRSAASRTPIPRWLELAAPDTGASASRFGFGLRYSVEASSLLPAFRRNPRGKAARLDVLHALIYDGKSSAFLKST